jgi:hypothetical protein
LKTDRTVLEEGLFGEQAKGLAIIDEEGELFLQLLRGPDHVLDVGLERAEERRALRGRGLEERHVVSIS